MPTSWPISSPCRPTNGSTERIRPLSAGESAHLIEKRGEIGARVRAHDQQEALNADFAVHLKTTLSAVRDLDYAEALSRLSQELFGLDAAQQAFARAQNLSLFKYI